MNSTQSVKQRACLGIFSIGISLALLAEVAKIVIDDNHQYCLN
jgi:hypothetical protein